MSARRMLASGAGVGLVYLTVVLVTFSFSERVIRPLFDGVHGVQPYRWVNPPPEEEALNQPAQLITGEVELTPKGSRAADFRTPDFQAGVVFFQQAFETRPGEKRVDVTITPLDPVTLGEPPSGLEYQGNAYKVEARYRTASSPAPLTATECDPTAKIYTCASIILRTPFGAFDIHRQTDDGWVALADSTETANDIFADSPELGTFVATAPRGHTAKALAARNQIPRAGVPLRDVIAISLGVVATVAGTVIYRRRLVARKREEVRKRAAGRKYKPPERKGRALKP